MTAASSLHASTTEVKALAAIATPNPSSTDFTIRVTSSDDAPVTLKIFDVAGRLLEVKTGLSANGTVKVAASYKAGIYFAELIQGNKKVRLKLLKQ